MDIEYYKLLAKQFNSSKSVCEEIINLESILHLPKGTEHFMSDLHGEYVAFRHILNNCSGVIKEKIKLYFKDVLTKEEMEELATLIYYPKEKISKGKKEGIVNCYWYHQNIENLILLIKKLSLKYTRSKVRKAIPNEFIYIIEELINERDHDSIFQIEYQQNIIKTIIEVEMADEFIYMMITLIKRLAVDRLHIIGDIYDRGQRSDKIIDMLIHHHQVDIQWGNHDVLWMGAACGNKACISRVVRNCVCYHNEKILENSYGISLRLVERFAKEKYPYLSRHESMVLYLSILVLKAEGQLILKHPEYHMTDQLKLNKIIKGTIIIEKQTYYLKNIMDKDTNYELTFNEGKLLDRLTEEFMRSEKLHQHIQFLYDKGSMYLRCNNTLLYHGCIPMNKAGEFSKVTIGKRNVSGKELLDTCDKMAREAYYEKKQYAIDLMFYLWSGYESPLSGRDLKTFERFLIKDKNTWVEKRNPYYEFYQNENICDEILKEFGLCTSDCHIINGHTPVKHYEIPVKASGKVVVIDGGFCKNYQKETGHAGYTLISNSHGLRIKSHTPFKGVERVLKINSDIHSTTKDIEVYKKRLLVKDTDEGTMIKKQIKNLYGLLDAYRGGFINKK